MTHEMSEVTLTEAEEQFIYDWAPGSRDGRTSMAADLGRLLADRLAAVDTERDRWAEEAVSWSIKAGRLSAQRDAAWREKAEVEARLQTAEALVDYYENKYGEAHDVAPVTVEVTP